MEEGLEEGGEGMMVLGSMLNGTDDIAIALTSITTVTVYAMDGWSSDSNI